MKYLLMLFLVWHYDTFITAGTTHSAKVEAIYFANKQKAVSIQLLPLDKNDLGMRDYCLLIWASESK